jgi:putative Mg2+ transporter-C (MgtC) family protein
MSDLINEIKPFAEPVGRLLLAAVLGSVLGVEREWHHRAAGLRTNMMVALGAAAFTLVAIELHRSGGAEEASRIPAQIVTGIGFLGGGAILRDRASIRGLTTAATVWVNAAIGMAAGGGFAVIAVSATVTALVVLTVLKRLERVMDQYRPPLDREPEATEPRRHHERRSNAPPKP